MIEWLLLLGIVVVVFLLLALFVWGMKKGVWLAINSVVGFFALYLFKIFVPTLVINFWSVIIVALFGIGGLLFVLVMHAFGIAF